MSAHFRANSSTTSSELPLSRPSVIPPLLMGDIMCTDLPFLNRWCDANNSLPTQSSLSPHSVLTQSSVLLATHAYKGLQFWCSPLTLHSEPSYRPTSLLSISTLKERAFAGGLRRQTTIYAHIHTFLSLLIWY